MKKYFLICFVFLTSSCTYHFNTIPDACNVDLETFCKGLLFSKDLSKVTNGRLNECLIRNMESLSTNCRIEYNCSNYDICYDNVIYEGSKWQNQNEFDMMMN